MSTLKCREERVRRVLRRLGARVAKTRRGWELQIGNDEPVNATLETLESLVPDRGDFEIAEAALRTGGLDALHELVCARLKERSQ